MTTVKIYLLVIHGRISWVSELGSACLTLPKETFQGDGQASPADFLASILLAAT